VPMTKLVESNARDLFPRPHKVGAGLS
jgi:hypothetical protein